MNARTRELVVALVAGLLFGAGLVIAGMTQPSKVIGFLDVADGSWDPSLAFVIAGAIGVHASVYQLLKRRPSPLFAALCTIPKRTEIDTKLVLGAALFGIGWGLGGFCPGPAVVSLVSGVQTTMAFGGAMLLSMGLVAALEPKSEEA